MAGRYPIQKNWQLNNKPRALGNKRRIPNLMVPDKDDALFNILIQKIKTKFEKELKIFYKDVRSAEVKA